MNAKRKMFFHIITASLFRRKSRMIIALLATAIGATILSGLITIYNDVPKQLATEFRNYGANMILTPNNNFFTDKEFEESVKKLNSEDLVGATPYLYDMVRIHEQPIQASGTDFLSLKKTSPYWAIEGEWPAKEKEMLMGVTVAENLGLEVGDSVTVNFTPEDKSLLDTMLDFKIVGTVNTGGNEENYIYISVADMEELTGASNRYDLAEISVAGSEEELDKYVEIIDSSVEGIDASLIKRVTASETTVLTKLQSLILLVTIIILSLTMICVTTTMTAVVSERRKEIGLRKAIGASDRSIFIEFMGEGVLLGACGGLLGAILGFVFAQFVSMNVFSSTITLNPVLVPLTIIATMLVTALACIVPIQSATKIDSALVLKGE